MLSVFLRLDEAVFSAIYHFYRPGILVGFFSLLTWLGNFGLIWWLLGALLFFKVSIAKRLDFLKVYLVTLSLNYGLVFLIKNTLPRTRPFGGEESFLSGHASLSFAAAVFLSAYFPENKKALYFLAGLIAFSRIYLGYHFPADVLAGSLLGYLTARTALKFFPKN